MSHISLFKRNEGKLLTLEIRSTFYILSQKSNCENIEIENRRWNFCFFLKTKKKTLHRKDENLFTIYIQQTEHKATKGQATVHFEVT